MRKRTLSVILMSLGICLSVQAKELDGVLQIKGSDTMVNLAQAWAERFMEVYPQVIVAVTGGGSGTGIASLISGTCDLAATSRQVRSKEVTLAQKYGATPKEWTVALDGIAVVVHPDNPVSELTLAQLADVFTGAVRNWSALGGEDAEIVMLSREVNSGTHVYFREHVLSTSTAGESQEFAPEALLLPSSQAIADEVANNPSGIGYYGMGYLSPKNKAVAVARSANEAYVLPKESAVQSGAYPIARPLFFYSSGDPNGVAKVFLDYVLSEAGQKTVLDIDFVPVRTIAE